MLTIPKKYMKEKERGPGGLEEKPLHGRFLRSTEGLASGKTWNWLRKGDLKKETKGLIVAVQDQSV